ncbi:quercetin 2,3-dioxygenase [Bhargavaea cecembensis]|uniref:Quercetin 2,3-dioxygenase n=1 Tax=Bhargavaea cecembensis TaxID=394098 RepID=A0A161RGN7_9BACL|nr:pirin family protein [Bhargavaea cecembensis]KZE37148.1 quercetin 2,3-dioxygenase [Bhargavaea cecembensis]
MDIYRSSQAFPAGNRFFSLKVNRPGLVNQDRDSDDYSFGPLARFDHATIKKGTKIRMHEHVNDEILSYIGSGQLLHRDSDGEEELLSPGRHMMMNAGKSFFHEESAPHGDVEMLQILIRPEKADLEPRVRFWDAGERAASGWTLIGGPSDSGAPLEIRQRVAVYEAKADAGTELKVPHMDGYTPWLYVFGGSIQVRGEVLEKGDGVSGTAEKLKGLTVLERAVLLLFLVDPDAEGTDSGTVSGIKRM